MQCTAKAKSTGEQCRRRAVSSSTKCTVHGGLTPRGIASPNFKTGRYSRHLPARLLERFEASLGDEELLNLSAEIALLDARLEDLLTRVDTGEAGAKWKEAQKIFEELRNAINAQAGVASFMAILRQLEETLHNGANDYAAWYEITALLDQRRKLVESERRRMIELEQVITAEQAMLLVSALLESVRRNVTDRHALSTIQADFVRLVRGGDRQRFSPDSES